MCPYPVGSSDLILIVRHLSSSQHSYTTPLSIYEVDVESGVYIFQLFEYLVFASGRLSPIVVTTVPEKKNALSKSQFMEHMTLKSLSTRIP